VKITIRHPAGLEIAFEGEPPEFDRFTSFLTELPAFVGTLGPTGATVPTSQLGSGLSGNADSAAPPGSIDARLVADQLATVGASTDMERVTVMAHFAQEAGLGGVDYAMVDRLYTELGMRKPTKMRATFSNAKQKGYVRSVGNGVWAATVTGENFARHGIRAGQRRARRGPQLAIGNGGGESD
jgi:hypothetical protein